MSERGILRILDAAANRAAEGLRTAEEFCRFIINDASLTSEAKELRHRLAAVLAVVPRDERLAARDTPNDVGTHITLESETRRLSAGEVAIAAMTRVHQSLRSIEEYGKTISPSMAADVEQIRYRSYALAQRIELGGQRHRRLEQACLYVLIDVRGDVEQWRARVRQVVDAGVDVVQIRDKSADDRLLYQRSQLAAEIICHGPAVGRCQLIINDRADIAAAVDADGVHVGQDELPVAAARRVLGDHKLVGLSTHSIEQARAAIADGADYIGCGPTFPSRTKSFSAFAGVEFLRQVAVESSLPAFAIGGIDATNVDLVRDAGCARVAVGEAIWGSDSPAAACQAFLERLRC